MLSWLNACVSAVNINYNVTNQLFKLCPKSYLKLELALKSYIYTILQFPVAISQNLWQEVNSALHADIYKRYQQTISDTHAHTAIHNHTHVIRTLLLGL